MTAVDDLSICELLAIWPIRLIFADRDWFTLWGGGGTDDDLVLAENTSLILSASLEAMYAHVGTTRSNMTQLPMFETFIDAIRVAAWPVSYIAHEYPFAMVPQWLRHNDTWSYEEADATLGALNLLWDIGRSTGTRSIVDALRPGGGILGNFLDDLYAAEGLLAKVRPPVDEVGRRVSARIPLWGGESLAIEFEAAVRTIREVAVEW